MTPEQALLTAEAEKRAVAAGYEKVAVAAGYHSPAFILAFLGYMAAKLPELRLVSQNQLLDLFREFEKEMAAPTPALNELQQLERVRKEFVELAEATHSMRGAAYLPWQDYFPELAETVSLLDALILKKKG